MFFFFFFQAEDGIRDAQESRGLGDVYKRQYQRRVRGVGASLMADAIPGQRLGNTSEFHGGRGTHTQNTWVYASVVGAIRTVPFGEGSMIEVLRENDAGTVLPAVGDLVLCKIVRVTQRHAQAAIMCVGETVLKESFNGMIRVEDIRLAEVDRLDVYNCFRPGDVVRAQVISLGDRRSYYLTTAKNELGVVFAQSEAGVCMVPMSWEEMVCPHTKVKEARKVAKVLVDEADVIHSEDQPEL
eukprot:TRINITY_DN23390_c0_g1_i1.p1 TRINITY_DN23390_c0_g1~~TRINITY_DN23390_c0_g1_i1.p1  ORF type:complete len:241 (-),score=62.56 TRINITY_DN23390_c0_g1_i1:376-1098(-)